MKIDLLFLLEKNKTSLKEFLAHHRVNSYQALVELCEVRRFAVVSEEYYNKHSGAEVTVTSDEKRSEEPKAKVSQPKNTKKKTSSTRRRRTSAPQKKQVTSTSSKKVKDT